jgi:hypothetical protein
MDAPLAILCSQIEARLNWGDAANWQGGDFRRLGEKIFERTGVSLSESTLRRVFGKAAYPHLPSETTLNTLAIFAGYSGWRAFKERSPVAVGGGEVKAVDTAVKRKINLPFLGATIVLLILAVVCFSFYWHNRHPKIDLAGCSFSGKSMTRSIPNSVVFTYHVPAGEVSPVYIQQSWDPTRRFQVPAGGSTYSSVYYRPGFFNAKLIVGSKVVKEFPLVVSTDGWSGMILHLPVPVYLEKREFQTDSMIVLGVDRISAHHIDPEPQAPEVQFYNVGNFSPVALKDVRFSALIRSNFYKGSGACMRAHAILITDGIPVTFALSARGCVATLRFFNGTNLVDARTTDLSGFGADLHNWVSIGCRADSGKLVMLIDQKPVYSCPLPPTAMHVLGIGFGFEGGGAVKSISLSEEGKQVFSAF